MVYHYLTDSTQSGIENPETVLAPCSHGCNEDPRLGVEAVACLCCDDTRECDGIITNNRLHIDTIIQTIDLLIDSQHHTQGYSDIRRPLSRCQYPPG